MNATAPETLIGQKPLVVIANLGRLRVLKHVGKGEDPRQKEHLVEQFDCVMDESGRPIREFVTDQSGRFGRHDPEGGGAGMESGEDHHLAAEMQGRTIARVVDKVAQFLKEEGYPRWSLVAPPMVLRRVEKGLPDECLQVLSTTLAADLTKWPIAMLENRLLKKV